MSAGDLQALLALRRAVVLLGASASPADKAQLDLMATVLARLIVERRALPPLRAQFDARLRACMQSAQAPSVDLQQLLRAERTAGQACGESGIDVAALADAATEFATAVDRALRIELAEAPKLLACAATQGDVFDDGAFREYLVRELGEPATIHITGSRLASRGFSKKTVLVDVQGARKLPAALALRIDRPFNFLETTVKDEFAPLKRLHQQGIRLPEPHALEATGQVIDGPFIVFDRVPGALVGNNFQAPARNPRLAADVAQCLAQLHRLPVDVPGAIQGAARSAREQVRKELDKSFGHWAALGLDIPLMEAAFNWLYANLDRAGRQRSVVHGDFNFNNILVEGDRVSAIVDWEFLQLGDPAWDLGWFYLGAKGIVGWREFLDLYAKAGGFRFDPDVLGYFKLLGQTRLAVMTLQTAAGFEQGQYDDIKFAVPGALYTNVAQQRVAGLLTEVLAR